MLRLAFDFIIAWREIRARPNAYRVKRTMPIGLIKYNGFIMHTS